MRFILCSDLHLTSRNPSARKDKVLETSINKMKAILDCAYKMKANILISGDLFNQSRDWDLLGQLMPLLTTDRDRRGGTSVYAVWGQHDMHMRNKSLSTSMGILIEAGLISDLDDTPCFFGDPYGDKGRNNAYVYGCDWGGPIPEPHTKGFNCLVIHAPISNKALYKGHEYISARKFLNENKFDLILCGDIHQRFVLWAPKKDRVIINTGPILRKDLNEYNTELDPSIALYDSRKRKIEWIRLNAEPASVVFDLDKYENKKEQTATMQKFIDELSSSNNTIRVAMIDRLKKWAKTNGADKNTISLLEEVCNTKLS